MSRLRRNLIYKVYPALRALDKSRQKIESLFDQGNLSRREVEQVYGNLFLNAVILLESFIENLFMGLLVGRIDPDSSKINPKVNFNSDRTARPIVYGGKKYVDWLPYSLTEERSQKFFRNGIPFTLLDKTDKDFLNTKVIYLRNTIAHKSNHSIRMFEKHVIYSLPLTPREGTPGGFLRSLFRMQPPQTRYEYFVNNIGVIVQKLCGKTKQRSNGLYLEPL